MKRGTDLPFMQYSHSCLREEDTDAIVMRCRALSSPERIRILRMLSERSMTVTEVAKALYMSVSTTTFHLQYRGGFNIFGKGFGDHAQGIRVEAEYETVLRKDCPPVPSVSSEGGGGRLRNR